MASPEARVILPSGVCAPVEGARSLGALTESEELWVTVCVRRDPDAIPLPSVEESGAELPRKRKRLSFEAVTRAFSASSKDLALVEDFARRYGLSVQKRSEAMRRIRLCGPSSRMGEAFGVSLCRYEYAGGRYHSHIDPVRIPEELDGIVEAVLGLDDRPIGSPNAKGSTLRIDHPLTKAFPENTYLPTDVARLYDFPEQDGEGQCIGVLALQYKNPDGGYYKGGYYKPALERYFTETLGYDQMPEIVDERVLGPGNQPGDDSLDAYFHGDMTAEIMLDLQMAGGIAPKAKLVVYFTEASASGWVEALKAAVNDLKNRPSVISISYGLAEENTNFGMTAEMKHQIHLMLEEAAHKSISVCCASGDYGSLDLMTDRQVHAHFPASSPYSLGCGGTRLESNGRRIVRELAWHDPVVGSTGGGVSRLFDLPDWQRGVNVPPVAGTTDDYGRGVPDVACVADPDTGVVVMAGKQDRLIVWGGTSASTPIWAGLIARMNQALGVPLGYFNPLLYQKCATGVLRDITQGVNGAYKCCVGWDACTGLGTPRGRELLKALMTE